MSRTSRLAFVSAASLFSLTACSSSDFGDQGGHQDGNISPAENARVDAFAISDLGYGASHQVRQGAGAVHLKLTGVRLAGASEPTLGDLACRVVGNSDTELQLECTVPHGAGLGMRQLVFKTTSGGGTVDEALEVTKIYVKADAPANGQATGTPASPYRSISQGVSAAGKGDTVFIAIPSGSSPPVYGVDTNEPMLIPTTSPNAGNVSATNIADGVTLEGEPFSSQDPGGLRPTLRGGSGYAAFRPRGDVTIKNLVIDQFRFGLIATGGSVSLENVAFTGTGDATSISAIDVSGPVTLTVSGQTANDHAGCDIGGFGGGAAILVHGSGYKASFDGCIVRDSKFGFSVGPDANNDAGRIAVSNTRITGSAEEGFVVAGTTDVTFNGVTVNANGGVGCKSTTQGRIKARHTVFDDNAEYQVLIDGKPAAADFGTVADAGENTFSRAAVAGYALLYVAGSASVLAAGSHFTVAGKSADALATGSFGGGTFTEFKPAGSSTAQQVWAIGVKAKLDFSK